jgi:hypothetical protein
LWSSWNAFVQIRLTGLTGATFDAQKPFIERIVKTLGGKWFWDEFADEFETDFRAEIEQIVAEP